jgi:hypothetical protein
VRDGDRNSTRMLRFQDLPPLHDYDSPPSSQCQCKPDHVNSNLVLYVFFFSRCLMFVYRPLVLPSNSDNHTVQMKISATVLLPRPVTSPGLSLCCESVTTSTQMAARIPSGMDEAESNWERFSAGRWVQYEGA